MFSLILVLLGLVLVATLAIATIYYGGKAATEGSANAEAAALLAQSAQIASASAAYTADTGQKPTSLDQLVSGNYLSAIPPGWQELGEGETPITSKIIESANACELFNAKQGIEGIPFCDEITTLTKPICCQ